MALIRSTGIEDPHDSIYGCGLCHVHAIAAARAHGGASDFLVVFDHEQPHWEDPDDADNMLPAVIHVYSVHACEGGEVARDILGDRHIGDAERECADLFAIGAPEAQRCDLDALLALTQGRETPEALASGCANPLSMVSEELVLEALSEDSVTAEMPGSRKETSPCP